VGVGQQEVEHPLLPLAPDGVVDDGVDERQVGVVLFGLAQGEVGEGQHLVGARHEVPLRIDAPSPGEIGRAAIRVLPRRRESLGDGTGDRGDGGRLVHRDFGLEEEAQGGEPDRRRQKQGQEAEQPAGLPRQETVRFEWRRARRAHESSG